MPTLLRENTEKIDYQVIFSKRKTLVIMVYPDKTVSVRAPMHTPADKIQQEIDRRTEWIKSKILYFDQQAPVPPPKKYVDGESHPYLGKCYQLVLVKGKSNSVFIKENFLYVICKSTPSPRTVQKNIEAWYLSEAKILFEKLLPSCWQRFNHLQYKQPRLKVRKMSSRWGSFSYQSLTVTLNSELIKSPLSCIEYVFFHEFCHIKHRYHDRGFYRLLEQVFPDWKNQKLLLETETVGKKDHAC